MRGFGILALIVGFIAVVGALAMDVSVSTGMGRRVNNIGLMAQQQNYLIIGALIALAGLLMTIFGGKKKLSSEQIASIMEAKDSRPCPFCAEPIKHAAIKCKHCQADVPAIERQAPSKGWTVRVPCRPGDEYATTRDNLKAEDLPIGKSEDPVVVIGPYDLKVAAIDVLRILHERHSIFGELHYDDGR
ncbi:MULTISPECIES: hypothetical protein [Pseudomonas]|uniref:hypothetical protein n=1 Tax=Pseudomonas TaxID=286 RepID=UPI001FA495FE|nr:hypothetical protein [Pseudomonas sp. HTZ1]MDS9590695.1 hypothetical protein [Pseudomonas sp. HTZ1]CAB5648347.1 Uncharacterised protein [Pseudomonas putida]